MGAVGLLDGLDVNAMFGAALGLAAPWQVVSVTFDEQVGRLDLGLDFPRGARFGCPDPGSAGRASSGTHRPHPARAPLGKSSARSSPPTCSSKVTDTTCHGAANPNAAPNIAFKSSPSSRPTAPIDPPGYTTGIGSQDD